MNSVLVFFAIVCLVSCRSVSYTNRGWGAQSAKTVTHKISDWKEDKDGCVHYIRTPDFFEAIDQKYNLGNNRSSAFVRKILGEPDGLNTNKDGNNTNMTYYYYMEHHCERSRDEGDGCYLIISFENDRTNQYSCSIICVCS